MNSEIHAFPCDFCDEVVLSQWGKIKACQQGKVDLMYLLCPTCYEKVHRAVKQALSGVIKQILLESVSAFQAEMRAAGWKK